ncbi:hypothetical protein F2Q68_00027145 [Brassica cretica]|uniref:Uncharacterized protein n=1 Tax=Brassica cretica TaxID=69181 RepID=A0A8S9IHG3_BRACR|nr:hypothetical protein F2Q68_00027145 [Brassica cretica]
MIGPTDEISFHGHPIVYIAPSVYGHAHALTIHFLSYAEKMVISIAVDPNVIPSPHQLCDEIEDSLKAIKAALLERGLLYNHRAASNARSLPRPSVDTRGVLICDDDVEVDKKSLEFALSVWKSNLDRLIGVRKVAVSAIAPSLKLYEKVQDLGYSMV